MQNRSYLENCMKTMAKRTLNKKRPKQHQNKALFYKNKLKILNKMTFIMKLQY